MPRERPIATVPLYARIPQTLYDRLADRSESGGEPLAALVREALENYLADTESTSTTRDARPRKAPASKSHSGAIRGGKPPYGFTFDGVEYLETPEEQAVLARMLELRSEGKGMAAIAKQLNAEGHRTRRGAEWGRRGVDTILRTKARQVSAETTTSPPAAEAKRSGGQPPYGFRWENKGTPDAHQVPDEAQQVVLARLLELNGEGLSMQQIADALNAEGHVGSRGGPWTKQTAHKVLKTHERNVA